jgi:thiol-disulfide isomerase/thioredoxin
MRVLPFREGFEMRFRRTLLTSLLRAAGVMLPSVVPGASDALAQPLLPPLLQVRPWLGVSMAAADSVSVGVGAGVGVGHVVRGSPAGRAGIREGDRIVRVDATPVMRGADVVRVVSSHRVGTVIDIAFIHAGVEHSASMALTAFPSQDEMMRMDLVGTFAPAWRDVQAVSGSFPSSIGAIRGKVVVLDFWATWCIPCRVVMPKLGDLQARYGAQGLAVLGVSAEEAQDVALFARHAAVPYAIGVDPHAETTRLYGVMSLPTLVVIDKRGVVREVAVGYDPAEDSRLETTVRALLAEAAPG